ncbi:STAS domain-containing protein [Amycolatopsis sp. lyj-90]|uniref:STAS domain-containing protein n=1 Tax=Amycolatopsis sp. lyj-90 TaxID=2789285 RepID=UPI003979783E
MERIWMPGLASAATVRMSCSPEGPAVIALTGELDSHTAVVVEMAVATALARSRGIRAIVMDLAEVTFLSVAGIQALHAAVDQAAAKGVTLRTALGPHSVAYRAMVTTGMIAVLDHYPDRHTALAVADLRSVN